MPQRGLVFGAHGQRAADLEALFEAEAASRLGVRADFFVRTATDCGRVIAGNPFPREAYPDGIGTSKLTGARIERALLAVPRETGTPC